MKTYYCGRSLSWLITLQSCSQQAHINTVWSPRVTALKVPPSSHFNLLLTYRLNIHSTKTQPQNLTPWAWHGPTNAILALTLMLKSATHIPMQRVMLWGLHAKSLQSMSKKNHYTHIPNKAIMTVASNHFNSWMIIEHQWHNVKV